MVYIDRESSNQIKTVGNFTLKYTVNPQNAPLWGVVGALAFFGSFLVRLGTATVYKKVLILNLFTEGQILDFHGQILFSFTNYLIL